MIGSEGTLGIITKVIIHLLPPPKHMLSLAVSFPDMEKGIQIVPEISKMGILPLAIEFMENDTVKAAEKFLDQRWPAQKGEAHLLIMIDGSSDNELLEMAKNIGNLCQNFGSQEIFVADTRSKQKKLLEFRSNIYETIKKYVIEILDIVVPPSEIPHHLKKVNELSHQYNLWLPTFGHAADGNVHTLPLKAHFKSGKWQKIPEDEWKKKYPEIRKALHQDARNRGGLVSAEHGIGMLKKEYLAEAVGDVPLQKMRMIKTVFDPKGILNPGKIF
jgi:glycolate oxidase